MPEGNGPAREEIDGNIDKPEIDVGDTPREAHHWLAFLGTAGAELISMGVLRVQHQALLGSSATALKTSIAWCERTK